MNLSNPPSRGFRVAILIPLMVATTVLGACSQTNQPVATPTQAATPLKTSPKPITIDIATEDPDMGDIMDFWSTGKVGESNGYAAELGIPALYDTQAKAASKGFFAIGELGKYCALVLSTTNTEVGNVTVLVASRYNNLVNSKSDNLTNDEVLRKVNYWREPCATGKYVPDGAEPVNVLATTV